MKARVLFGVGGFAVVLLALYVFPPLVLALLLGALCGIAAYEMLAPTGLVRDKAMQTLCVGSAAAYGLVLCVSDAAGRPVGQGMLLRVLALMLLVGLFACLLRRHDSITFQNVACGFFGALLLPYFLLSLWRIFRMDGGPFLVLLPLVAAWGSDTCALFAGMAFGKHKLAPVISPKKTVEGAVGGVVGAAVLSLVVALLFAWFGVAQVHLGAALLLGVAGAAIGQVGDLSFSIIKRQTGIKDYGRIFPGHGGVLDRFDSVIFVAPVVEIILDLSAGM